MTMTKTTKKLKISVVIPMFNEENTVEVTLNEVVKSLKKYEGSYEIIFVDDCSTDNSIKYLKKARNNSAVKIISMRKNVGHMRALCVGLGVAKGNCVISLDCDLQDPPRYIPVLIAEYFDLLAKKIPVDVIQTVRNDRNSDTLFKALTAKIYYKLIGSITGVNVIKNAADFRLMSRTCVNIVTQLPEKEKILRLLIPALGFKVHEIEIKREKRYAGKSKYPIFKMMALAISSALSFTFKPLRILGVIGLFASFVMFFLAIIFAALWAQGKTVPGWTSIVFLILSTNAALFAAVGLLGEYVGRIYMQVQNRPEIIFDEL